jgi:hypothetical protein
MMWDYDGLIGKARIYFERAEAVDEADDDAFAVWLLLGLEFLLRAPLAKVNPVLLADPNGDAILHAAGFPSGPDAKDPKVDSNHDRDLAANADRRDVHDGPRERCADPGGSS